MKQSLDCRGLAYLPKKWRGNRIGHLTYPLNLSEPTGCCPCEFLLVRSRLRGTGDDTIGRTRIVLKPNWSTALPAT